MLQGIENWQKHTRAAVDLPCAPGVYALFLQDCSRGLPIQRGAENLLYIGRARNLRRRCHFDGSTRNHSPRKSLATLLMNELELQPVLVRKGLSRATWGLDDRSERRLSEWMHANLSIAFQRCDEFVQRESELIARYQPPLNISQCNVTTERTALSLARRTVLDGLLNEGDLPNPKPVRLQPVTTSALGTAVELAEAFGLDPKAFRQRLRMSVRWYRKPQV